MTPGAGHILGGKVRLERELGRGAFGTVWAAHHAELGRRVAVKILDAALATNPKVAARFFHEAETVARLRNPHIVEVHGWDMTADRNPYIVMELLSGEDLGQRMGRLGQLPFSEIVDIVGQTCIALDAAHERQVIHRDIKPANIFLLATHSGLLVKLLDFGIAKQMEGDLSLTASNTLLGTPRYMSPEQLRDARHADHRADLWSVAVVAYECLLGRPPFVGPSIVSLRLAMEKGRPVVPTLLRPELGAEVDAWVERAFDRQIEARFQTARELAAALSHACRTQPAPSPVRDRDLAIGPTAAMPELQPVPLSTIIMEAAPDLGATVALSDDAPARPAIDPWTPFKTVAIEPVPDSSPAPAHNLGATVHDPSLSAIPPPGTGPSLAPSVPPPPRRSVRPAARTDPRMVLTLIGVSLVVLALVVWALLLASCAAPPPARPRLPALAAPKATDLTVAPHNERLCVGDHFSCARMADGAVFCWGDNRRGQLGSGSIESRSEPVEVLGVADAAEVACAANQACARSIVGRVTCWGIPAPDEYRAPIPTRLLPEAVPELDGAVQIALGSGGMCAVQQNDRLTCRSAPHLPAQQLPSFGSVTHIAIGQARTCAVGVDGTLACWGLDLCGGATRPPSKARRHFFHDDALWAGASQRLPVLFADGTLRLHGCQIGPNASDEPQQVAALTHVVRAFDDANHTCAVRSDRSVWCAGWDGGRIMPVKMLAGSFVEVPMLRGATDLALGQSHGCAGYPGGGIRCWGYDAIGELGRGEHSYMMATGGERQWLELAAIHPRDDERPWQFDPSPMPMGTASLPPASGPCGERACKERGLCTNVDGTCVAGSDAHCRASDDCKERGACSAVEGRCRAANDSSCGRSLVCESSGACVAEDGACVVARDEDCARSTLCERTGRCTAKTGACEVASDAGCQKTRGCREEGRCAYRNGECAATSEQDCHHAARCRDHGCVFSEGRCVAYPELDGG